MAFKVMDKESIKDDDFVRGMVAFSDWHVLERTMWNVLRSWLQVGSATVSMAAVASSGRWSGDLAL